MPSNVPTPTAALAAETFDQSIGVNVHLPYTWTAYGDIALVESSLAYLGIDHVRDKLENSAYVPTANYEQLAADGIKFDFFLPVYVPSGTEPNTVNVSEFVSMVGALVAAYPGSVSAIEGANEVNLWSATYDGGDTLADQAALQQALYAAVRSDPGLNGIPVYNLSMAFTDATEDAALGNLSSDANYANSHAYLNDAQTPQYSMSVILPYAQIDAPGLPTVITETGYETNVADTYGGVDDTAQAKLTLDELMDAYKDGVSQTYLYELFDEGSQYYGLFTAGGTPKLAATAIHDLTTLLADPGDNSSFTPGSLSYAVPNLPTNGNQLLLEKSNGTFDLVLWAEAQIWNPNTASEIAAPSEAATVDFGQTENVVLVFDPVQGTAPIAAYLNAQSIQVTLTDDPIVVEMPSTTAALATPTINGSSAGNGSASDGITLTGTAMADSTLLVFDNATQIGTAAANTNGTWSFATGTLAGGTNAFTALVVDTSGDVSALSTALDVNISAPASVAAVTVPIIYDYSITATDQLILTGTAAANTTVNVFDGTTLVGTAASNTSGSWSYTTASLGDGDYTFTATATDAAGNTSASSNSIDPVISSPPTVASIALSGAGISNGNGDVRTGSTVTVTLSTSGTVVVADGTPTLSLSDGETAIYTGSFGTDTSALTFNYTVAAADSTPDLTVSALNLNGAVIEDTVGDALVGALPNPAGVLQINATDLPTVASVATSGAGITDGNGDLNAGHVVTLTLNMSEVVTVAGGTPTLTLNDGGTATYSGGSGSSALTFSYTVGSGQNTPDLAVTAVNLNGASITNGAGNNASFSGTLSPAGTLQIDTTPPAAPVIASDTVNANNTVTLNGTAAAASTVTVYDGQTALGTATANASGAWSYTTGPLANGSLIFTATATDAAGNTSTTSNAVDPTVGALTGVQAGTVSVTDGTRLEITATVDNTGTIALDATGDGADLAVVGSTTLTGSGKVTLSNNAGNLIGSNGAPAILTNVNNTIAGAGTIGDDDLTLINQGVIDANQTAALVINTASNTITNYGTLQATANGGLDIESNVSNATTIEAYGTSAKVVIESSVTNATTGLILASGSDAQINLDNATISDGTLQTSGSTDLIETVGGSANALDGLTISRNSTVEINPGSTLTLNGTIANSGTLLVNGGLLDVDGVLTGGVTDINASGEVVISKASSEALDFLSKSTGKLVLEQATSYSGQISGFKLGQSIDLTDIDFAAGVTMSYRSNNRSNTSGVLTITDGTNTAKLQMAGSYTLANFTVASDGNGGTLLTDPPVDTTNYTIANGTTLTIPTPAASTETFAGNGGALVLDDSTGFGGKIAGFGGQDAILLSDLGFGANTTLGYAATGSDSGTLTVSSGNQTVQLAMLGSYIASSFVAASDGFGGTMITEAAQTTPHPPLTAAHAT